MPGAIQVTVREPAGDLEASGWERRFEAPVARVGELTELYESLGYEVETRPIDPGGFGPQCAGCVLVACERYVVLYTRRPEAGVAR